MKNILKYDRYKFSTLVFGFSFSIIASWTLLSFFYAWALDEGTLGNNPFDIFMAESFNVWRFPFHLLLFLLMEISQFFSLLFFPFLILNILFYATVIERVLAIVLFRRIPKNENLG
jgi:hypothetical protein